MKGNVDSVTTSKSGKAWRVKVGDKFYGANFDSKLDTMIGKAIEFDFDDGKFGPWIKTWGPDHTQPSTPTPQGPTASPRQSNGDRYWLAFVSNQVAHAIAAGIIKEPQQMRVWAVAAKGAVEAADGQDLPF